MATIDVAMESTSQEILSAISAGSTPVFRSPVRAVPFSATTTAVTGTGKGKLFLNLVHTSTNIFKYTLIVDGTTLLNKYASPYEGFVEFEFAQSFSINSNDDGYPASGIAVFY